MVTYQTFNLLGVSALDYLCVFLSLMLKTRNGSAHLLDES